MSGDRNDAVDIPSMANSMANHGFGQFMDGMLTEMVWDNREKIHDIVDAIIAQRKRVEGKGRMKKAVTSQSGPAYTKRDPKITPDARTFSDSSCSTVMNLPSRSNMEDIDERHNAVATVGTQWDRCFGHCAEAVRNIITEARRNNCKYFDKEFFFDKRENMYPDGTPADCSVTEPKLVARLSELYPTAKLFEDSTTADDITQGEVGDCFLIGAISALAASNAKPNIKHLFVHFDTAIGVYGVMFYKCGGWEWVIIDDIVPVVKERSGSRYPLYASSTGQTTELWPMVLEKAYAKMHYNWSIVDGGWAKEALVDMTGGVPTALDLSTADGEFPFDRFMPLCTNSMTVLACAVPENVKEVKGAGGRAGETSALFGLFKGHQYAVIDAKQTSDGQQFVKCRNPWGNDAEWKGPYSDRSAEWTKFPKHKKELQPAFADDGEFWMRYSDFKKYLGIVDIVTTVPEDYNVLTMFGQASSVMIPENTYVLQVCEEAVELAIVLGQDDPKIKFGKARDHERQFSNYASLKFTIYKMKEIPEKHDDIRDHMQGKLQSITIRERSVSVTQRFEPGAYIIFPSVFTPIEQPDIGVYMRIIGEEKANFALHRPYDAESSRKDLSQVVGDCAPLRDAMGKGAEMLGAISRRSTMVGSPLSRNKASPIRNGEEPESPTTTLYAELQEQRNYTGRMEALAKQQQEQIEALKAQLAASQSSPLTSSSQGLSPSPQSTLGVSQGRIAPFANASARGLLSPVETAWDRLRMSKGRLEELIEIVFKELGGGKELSTEDAVNGVRLLVTTGTGLDDIAYAHPLCMNTATGSFDLETFAKLCSDSIIQWEAVGEPMKAK